ncbi:helix-turn-helix transcriptional regulator [Ferruginibacter paludis]|uniref:helix-turn-helix transcriptional regulator n=1 Tax=Ferruginibacter paludis TaxID=1310417 RepID=UPI0025B28814|nr:helix-turn-helix transcriptional regulator [Ferruginibacter paludis]MDN3658079.1 helix-turn-helix transcriptional regulator [Ferruginibacter paludis]
MQISPADKLSGLIKHYLFLESNQSQIRKLRLFSDGNPAMVLSLRNNLADFSNDNGLPQYLPGSFLYGQLTNFRDIHMFNETALIIVVFQPTGLYQLLGTHIAQMQDAIVQTEDLLGKKAISLQEKLADNFSPGKAVHLLNSFFMDILVRKSFIDITMVNAAVNCIVSNKGIVPIRHLVKLTGYSERHIERKFIESVGIAPKKFAGIVQLHCFLKQLKKGENLTAVAYAAGYADQSHLIKTFKKHTGITPKLYLGKAQKLASNFVEFAEM